MPGKKIVFIADDLQTMGGVQRFTNNLANGLAADNLVSVIDLDGIDSSDFWEWGARIQMVRINLDKDRLTQATRKGLFRSIARRIHFRRLAKRVNKLLAQISPDVVIIPRFEFAVRFVPLLTPRGAKVFVRESNTPVRRTDSVSRRVQRRFAKYVDVLVVPSDGTQAYYEEMFGNTVKVTKLYNPVPEKAFKAACVREKSDVNQGRMVTFCRIHQNKGLDMMLDAMLLVKQKLPNWHLDIIGNGSYESEINKRISSLDLGKNVSLLPATPEILSKLGQYDIYLNTSRKEGFCNAMAEAMATGLPSLSVDWAEGAYELAPTAKHGVVVPLSDKVRYCREGYYSAKDVENLSDEITSFALDSERRVEASAVGIEYMKHSRSLSCIIENWQALLA